MGSTLPGSSARSVDPACGSALVAEAQKEEAMYVEAPGVQLLAIATTRAFYSPRARGPAVSLYVDLSFP